MINEFSNQPLNRDREKLKVNRMNKERVCQKKLDLKKRMAEMQYQREIRAIMEA